MKKQNHYSCKVFIGVVLLSILLSMGSCTERREPAAGKTAKQHPALRYLQPGGIISFYALIIFNTANK
jgi:hypothetical protein